MKILRAKIMYLTWVLIPISCLGSCVAQPSCSELKDYSFSPMKSEVSIDNGEVATIEFQFYPIPDQELSFHSAAEEQFVLVSPAGRIERNPFKITKRSSEIVSKKYSQQEPLLVQFNVLRRDQNDGTLLLTFGEHGQLQAIRDKSIPVVVTLYPATTCLLDSNDGIRSDEVTLLLQ